MRISEEDTGSVFLEKVLPGECDAIRRRREVLGREFSPPARKVDSGADESSRECPFDEPRELATAGLALSGGGIRSATFSLGILQALDRLGLFKGFDYISTVSGGGFVGAALSAWFASRKGPSGDGGFPFRTAATGESAELVHLRDNSKYLSPRGPLSAFLLPAHLIRGFLFNLVLLLPWLMAAAWLTVLFEKGTWLWPLLSKAFPALAFLLFLVTVMGYTGARDPRNRERWQNWMKLAFAGLAGAGLLLVLSLVVDSAFTATAMLLRLETSLLDLAGWFFADGGWKRLLGGAVAVGFMLMTPLPRWLSALRGKLVLVATSLLVPAALFLLYIVLCVWAGVLSSRLPIELDPPFNLEGYTIERGGGQIWVLSSSQPAEKGGDGKPVEVVLVARIDDEREVVLERAGEPLARSDALARLERVTGRQLLPEERYVEVYAVEPGETERLVERRQVAATAGGEGIAPPAPEIEPTDEEAEEPAETEEPADGRLSIELEDGELFLRVGGGLPMVDEPVRERSYYLVGFIVALLLFVFGRNVDPNLLSWHGYYRDRLAHAYKLGEVKLSKLQTEEAGGPYPLINAALNAPTSEEPSMRRRGVDFFLFSPRFVGSEHTGYCPTKEFEELDPNFRLSSATAISAAAASPIMGTYTLWPLVFSLTMLNLRLNYWAPNPGHESRGGATARHGANPWCLVREATGKVGTNGAKVNLSDGGHVENLGAHELLKRHCRFILAVDGEQDPEFGFGSLAALIRYARIDLQTEIRIDLSRLGRTGRWSRSHWALGTIDYPGGGQGHLLYVKASLTGDEGPEVLAYARDTAFPHESTANQSFSETQFEAYRALGEHIGRTVESELPDEEAGGRLLAVLKGPTTDDHQDRGDRRGGA